MKLKVVGKHERDAFIVELPSATPVKDAVPLLAEIWNLRLRLQWYNTCSRSLLKEHLSESNTQLAVVVTECEAAISIAGNPKTLTKEQLEEFVRNIKGAVIIGYPAEASDIQKTHKDMESLDIDTNDQLRKQHILNIMDDMKMADANEILEPETAVCWSCNKKWERDDLVSKYGGTNEKTTLTVKLTKTGNNAPARPPPVNQKEQSEMMQWYHKRQEEEKRLAEDDEITYASSAWADSKSLATNLQGFGTGDIKLPPGRLI